MLKGKTAVVTGSTSGIGLGIARVFAQDGADVVINGFGDKAAIEKERASIEKDFGVKATYSAADMTKPAEIADMIKTPRRPSARSTSWSTMPASSTSIRSKTFRSRNGIRSSRSISRPRSTRAARRSPA